ncbi:MAG TPA: M15 family metallopeptidase [Rhodanobacteraceae bacterium]|nr:M15 family metallopeptidase [Rhodanobacteraceae bacterium]
MRQLCLAVLLTLASVCPLHAAEAVSACRDAGIDPAYRARIDAIGRALGIPPDYALRHRMRLYPEQSNLRDGGRDVYGRRLRLAPDALAALTRLIAAAGRDHIRLQAVSGYRSVHHQRALLEAKLARGMPLDDALAINAAPGYSEHQTGCAVDLTTPGVPAADGRFARSKAYRWLLQHAGDYGFQLSYPPGNAYGIEFEPWHWRYRPALAPAGVASTPGVP